MLRSAEIPVSFVTRKWGQKWSRAGIQLSANDPFEELTKISTKNSTAFDEV